MSKSFGTALLVASSLALAAATPAAAFETVVTNIDKNKDGSTTYHFAIATDPGETLSAGDPKTADFVTIYNFYGLVEGSVKSPAGWTFSSEEFGRTPTSNGTPMVLPLDVPNTPNLTWTPTKPITSAGRIEGFSATTRVATHVEGQYTAQVSRQMPALMGDGAAAKPSKQALIGTLPMPTFLAAVK